MTKTVVERWMLVTYMSFVTMEQKPITTKEFARSCQLGKLLHNNKSLLTNFSYTWSLALCKLHMQLCTVPVNNIQCTGKWLKVTKFRK